MTKRRNRIEDNSRWLSNRGARQRFRRPEREGTDRGAGRSPARGARRADHDGTQGGDHELQDHG